jgi:uncharacterized protein (TIGR02284 family)
MKRQKVDDPARVLARLLERCVDGMEGYRLASSVVKEPAWLARALASAACEREAVVNVLTSTLEELGSHAVAHGSLRGTAHRGLMEALTAFSPNAPEAIRTILRECERGERAALEAFSHALGRTLPDEIRRVVQAQFGRLLEASAALRREVAAIDELVAASPGQAGGA